MANVLGGRGGPAVKIFIAGLDGYLGWALAQHLAEQGHTVSGCDNLSRRQRVKEVGGNSVIPIAALPKRLDAFYNHYGYHPECHLLDMQDFDELHRALGSVAPDAIVHLAEQPSAAFSMRSAKDAADTHAGNVIGTLNLLWVMREVCPDAHLVKLGTMGEYGTPNIDIPEGFFEVEYRGRKDLLPFPRQAGSFYHLTKVHDSNNVHFACRTWALRATDIMQGVVFGTLAVSDPRMATRLDYDECFGTVVNRFACLAAVGHPLPVYGEGGQTRGFIPLKDAMRCLTLALESPPQAGEYRVFNQFAVTMSVLEVAKWVRDTGNGMGLDIPVDYIGNPRVEAEEHYYNPDCHKLFELGYEPTSLNDGLEAMMLDILRHRQRIEGPARMMPEVMWK